jgi:hydrogenase expression/formation protein HypE
MSKGNNSRGVVPTRAVQCPVPFRKNDAVLLGHGSGGKLTSDLVREVFLPAFSNSALDHLSDSAELQLEGKRIVFTTDSFVVSPWRFPGGNLGDIAVNGTVNDLAVSGASPVALSAAFILEEGFSIADLRAIVESMRAAAARAGVHIVTADTKVVERGKGDGVFITTSGVGLLPEGMNLAPERIKPGDAIIVSGPLGDHGIAVMCAREGLEFETTVRSDTAPLHQLVATMLATGAEIRCMRDVTRGGLATVLNEIAIAASVQMLLSEPDLPVRDAVRAACEILGLDPLYVACEGRLVAIVDQRGTQSLLAAMRSHPLGSDALQVGTVVCRSEARVLVRTAFGTTRMVDTLPGALLPRIC